MNHFHLGIGFIGKTVSELVIQNTFPTHAGWARYAPNCWLLSTTETAQQVMARVRTVLSADDSILVVPINLEDRGGWLQPAIWEWINNQTRDYPRPRNSF